MKPTFHHRCTALLLFIFLAVFRSSLPAQSNDDADRPEVALGERLFLEPRFAQYFFTNSGGNVNATLAAGDPVMDSTITTSNLLSGPFAGQSMNCRACHLVDEHNATLGNRTYSDFARRSPIPARGDGRSVTPRNSPTLVGASSDRRPFFLHFDGEFATARDLVKGTLTGRNYGWLATEQATAIAHIANVIRNDNGSGELAQQFGGSYRVVLAGTAPGIPAELRLSQKFRIDVNHANDRQILNAVAALIEAYLKGLEFATDEDGAFAGSPYDVFLIKNKLPRQPAETESDLDYSRRLLREIRKQSTLRFVTDADGSFTTHDQPFQFGAMELEGLKMFLTEANPGLLPGEAIDAGKIGNCVACHAAPFSPISDFTIPARRRKNTTPFTAMAHLHNWPFRRSKNERRTTMLTCNRRRVIRTRADASSPCLRQTGPAMLISGFGMYSATPMSRSRS